MDVFRRVSHAGDSGRPSRCRRRRRRLMDGGELWERISRCWSSLLTSDGLGTVDARTRLKPGAPENLQQARREAKNKQNKQTKAEARTDAGWHVPIDIWGKNLEAHRGGTWWHLIDWWTQCSNMLIGQSMDDHFYCLFRKFILNHFHLKINLHEAARLNCQNNFTEL